MDLFIAEAALHIYVEVEAILTKSRIDKFVV